MHLWWCLHATAKKIEKEMKGVDLNVHAPVILMLEKAIHYFHIPGTIGVW